MDGREESGLTRRGFIVLATSAFGAFFIKPSFAKASDSGKKYLVSVQAIGYGYLWPKEWIDEDDESIFGPDPVEMQREALGPGSILYFERDSSIPEDAAWLDVVTSDGDKLCDIPWRATPEEEEAVMLIVDKINDGYEVWAEVTDADHATIDAGPDDARIHHIEFDVFYK